jgi:hypothetical protein
MPPYTAFTAYTTFTAASVPKPFISTVRQLNMANTSEILSDVSSKVDTCSARLSAVEIEADAGLVSTTQCNGTYKMQSNLLCRLHYSKILS